MAKKKSKKAFEELQESLEEEKDDIAAGAEPFMLEIEVLKHGPRALFLREVSTSGTIEPADEPFEIGHAFGGSMPILRLGDDWFTIDLAKVLQAIQAKRIDHATRQSLKCLRSQPKS